MVDKQKIIHHWHVEKKSEVEIASLLGVSRNTVRRYIKSFVRALEQSQASGLPEPVLSDFLLTVPKYNAKNRGKRKLTTEIIQEIDRHLRENDEKRRTGKRKQIVKGIDIWEMLQASGHDIGYTVVCDYILLKKSGKQEAFIRQEYNPGENCEFDWCDIKITIGGIERTLYLAVFTMCKSNYRFAMVFQRQDTLAFMEAHIAFFDHLGRVPLRMNYDNMRVAISKFVGPQEKKPTVALLQLSTFYGFSFRFCNIFCGHEKGHVERSVEYIRRKAFARKDLFDTIASSQNYLETICNGLNDKTLTGSTFTIGQLMAEERNLMLPHPGRMECFLLQEAHVGKYSTFVLGNNHYSVPDHLVGQKVDVKVYANQLKVYHQGKILDSHVRDYGTGRWITTYAPWRESPAPSMVRQLSNRLRGKSGKSTSQSSPKMPGILSRYCNMLKPTRSPMNDCGRFISNYCLPAHLTSVWTSLKHCWGIIHRRLLSPILTQRSPGMQEKY
jgi:hypothetical protein